MIFKIIYTFTFAVRTFFMKHVFWSNQIKNYVGTDETSGLVQLDLLKKTGCNSSSNVLEIGCGALHLSIPLIKYLEKNKYVVVDPNSWLREKNVNNNQNLIEQKQAIFLNVEDFDVSTLTRKFDFIFSHSILSHVAHWQLEQFLKNCSNVLSKDGKILSSIVLAEGNEFGSKGSKDKKDSMDKEWVYPFISWFRFSTVKQMASKYDLLVEHKPEYTEHYIKNTKPHEFHDWLIFYKNS